MPDEPNPPRQDLHQEAAFLALADALSPLVSLIQGDKIVYMNPAGCALLGRARDEIVGHDFWEFSVPQERESVRDRGRARQAGADTPRRFTERVRHADGHDVWIDYSIDVLRLDGKTTTLVTGHDVSEQKRTEEALRLSEERFRSAFENAAVGKAIALPDQTFVRVNRAYCEMLGYTEGELLGRKPLEITHVDDHPENSALIRRLLTGDVPSGRMIKRYLRKDGAVVIADLTLTLVRDAQGKPGFFIAEAVDVSERVRAEELLRDREAKLAEAQRIAHIGHWEHDIASDRSTWSQEFYRIGEVDPELVHPSKEEFFRRVHPDDRARIATLVERAIVRGAPYEFEARLLLDSGAVKWIHSIARVDRDAAGKPARIYGVAQEITARKQAEEALQISDERFRAAFENAAIGKAITGTDLRFLQVNRAFCEMLGYTEDELLAQSPVELAHPEDRAETRDMVARLLGGGHSGRMLKRYLHKDGRTVWGDLTTTIVRDATGKPGFFVSEIIDVTERKRGEELLREREANLAEAQRVAHLGSWEYDIATKRSVWSDEMYRIFGFEPQGFDPTRDSATARIHPDDVARSGAHVQETIETGKPYEYEFRIVRDDGEVRSLWTIGRAELGADGRPSRVYGIVQDVTERKRAEEALRASEQRFRDLYTQAPVMMTVTGADRRFREVSNYWLARMGYEREEVVGREGHTFITPDSQANLFAAYQDTVARGERVVRSTPLQGVRKDGTTIDVLTTSLLDLDERGEFQGVITVGLDVTELRRAEEAVRASEQRFHDLYTQAPVLLTVIGPDLCFREVSNFWLEHFGYKRHEVIGRPALDFVAPELHATVVEELQRTLAAGERVIRSRPARGIRKDGTHVEALVTSLLEVDAQGRFQGAVTVGLDVTHMRRAEEALRESEARYRALVQHAPEAIVVADGDNGKFVDVNEEAVRLFRRTREELLSLGPAECSPPFQPNGRTSADMAQDMIQRTALETQAFEWIHLDGEGRDIPCLIRLSQMPDRTRKLIRATITDISQQKALEEKLRQDDRMAAIGVLAAGVAHEIGNPLLALSMAAQSLQRKAQDEYAAKKLALIREHIDRISRIVRQMSDLARAPAQTRSPVDLNRVLERSMEVIRYDKRAKQVSIQVDPCGKIPFVQAAEDQLVQVCLNLALNALDAVAANPPERPRSLRIGVRCLEREGRRYVRTGFQDSGPGIPEASRAKIFQPFFTTKEPGKGTGLGLSVSYRIIEEHQGKLAFETDPARGTEFYFELPVREKP